MSEQRVDEFLSHYGKKGMKWGVRKASVTRKTSGDHKTKEKLGKKHVSELTNRQIQTFNNRVNLEQNFTRLNPSKVNKGQRIAKSLLATAGTAVSLYNLVNSPAGKAAIDAGRKAVKK